ncbi:MAG: Do family serine endopeptidase [Phycisphaerae bacterium]
MAVTERRRSSVAIVVLVVAVLGLAFHQQIVGGLAYAVEKGRIQANSEELAKVEAISNVFRMVAKAVRPSVVRIVTKRAPKASPLQDLPEPLREFFRQRGGPEMPEPQPEGGLGSGVIIDADKGYVLTNNHVVGGAKQIEVYLADGRRMTGKLLGADDKTDLALVEIKPERLHAARLGDSDAMEVGDWVLAIGAPFGLEQTVSQGIVSAKGRSNVGIVDYEDFIQTDAAINPGNSGGPLVNLRGEVIGINTAIATNPMVAGYMGIGFAIPSKMVKEILPDLAEGRKIIRGYLGVSIRSLRQDPDLAANFGLKEPTGALVEEVMPNTPASKAGLKVEDIILEYNGKPVHDNAELTALVAGTKPGTKVKLTVWRDKKKIQLEAQIAAQPKGFSPRAWLRGQRTPTEAPGETVELESLGLTVAELTPELAKKYGYSDEAKGIIVTAVDPYGEAAAAQIRVGDLIVAAQGKEVSTPQEFEEIATPEALKKGIRVRVKNKVGSHTVFLQVENNDKEKDKDE